MHEDVLRFFESFKVIFHLLISGFPSIPSHLPTHRITVYPMVTIRISDRHRLIQPYIHNYSWLLFATLALYTSDLTSEKELEGEALDSGLLAKAVLLQTRCSELIADCLLKGQTGKGWHLSADFWSRRMLFHVFTLFLYFCVSS